MAASPTIWTDATGDMVLNVASSDVFFYTIAGTTEYRMTSAEFDVNNNEIIDVKGIDFQNGGPVDTSSGATIWAEASGDMTFNVASADQFFFTINGATRFTMIEGEAEFVSTDQHGVDLVLNNQDANPVNNDQVGTIIFKGDDDGGSENTWGTIRFDYENVVAGAKQAQFEVRCQTDNALVPIIDFTGADAVFRFSSGVDVVTPNRDDAIDLGTATLEWKDLFIDGTATIDTLNVDVASDFNSTDITDMGKIKFSLTTQSIDSDAGGLILDVPSGDDFDFKVATVSEMTLSSTQLDLQANNIVDCGNITPSATDTDDLGTASLVWRRVFFEALRTGTLGQAITDDGNGFLHQVLVADRISFTVGNDEQISVQDNLSIFGGVIRLKDFSDTTRPTATTAGAGGIIYSTTDNVPIYSDGTNWRLFSDNSAT